MTEQEIAALKLELETAKTDSAALQAKLADAEKRADDLAKEVGEIKAKAAADAATAAVEAACKEGRLAPEAAIKAKWVETLTADPAKKDLLDALPVNAAFTQVIKAKAAAPDDNKGKTGAARLAATIKLPQ